MSTDILLMASPGSKRAFETTINESSPHRIVPSKHPNPSTPPQLHKTTVVPNPIDLPSSRASTPLSSVRDMSTDPSSPPSGIASAVKAEPEAKKRKLTFAEKDTLRIEKQFKEMQKDEEKVRKEAQKEAEKREKEERKLAIAEEKEAKRLQQEAEKAQKRKEQEEAKEEKRRAKEEKDAVKQAELAAKEAEKKAKEEEKAKKARSQMRLNAFFVKREPSAGSAASSRRNSISSIYESPKKGELATVTTVTERAEESDYAKLFPPFFLHVNTTFAPQTQFECDEERLEHIRANLDACLTQQSGIVPSLKRSFGEASYEPSTKRRRLGAGIVAAKDLVAKINTQLSMIDLTRSNTSTKVSTTLSTVPVKYLRYAEDVRPPYIGTFTRRPVSYSVKRLCRNPFLRALPKMNYDYDSEAEWEEIEEGDDCDVDEDDSEDDADDDIAEFLDDADDAPKRQNVMGDMEPVQTSLFWQGSEHRRGPIEVSYGNSTIDLDQFRICALRVEATGPIDPFSTSYWEPPQATKAAADSATMAPPSRIPLVPLVSSNNLLTVDGASGLAFKPPPSGLSGSVSTSKVKGSAKPFPAELLDGFKREIESSDLSKIGLVEVLKKKFPQVTGKTITETLPMIAKRDKAEKKWVLL